MVAKLEAKEHNLVKIFGNDFVFHIPDYQRPYTWTTEEVDELLGDLRSAMQHDSDAPYFLGSIVIIKEDTIPASEVVDGQQRLSTLTMLVCVLRDLTDNTTLHKYVLQEEDEIAGIEKVYRVSLRKRDRDYFRQNVQLRDGTSAFVEAEHINYSTDSQERIHENVKFLHNQLKNHSTEELKELAIYIVRQCYLVVVSAWEGETAHRIFSVMNDRGMDLSPTDILKAEVLREMPDEAQESYADKWEAIEEEHGRDGFRDLFAHIRMIYKKDKMRGTLSTEFRDSVFAHKNGSAFFDEVLEPYSRVYDDVAMASYESSSNTSKVSETLGHLRRLDNFDWIPPAMAYFHRFKGREDYISEFTRDLERLAYGLFIIRRNINDRINRYADILNAIEEDEDLFQEGSPLQLTTSECEEVLSQLGDDIYKYVRVRRPLLLRLDSLLAEGTATYDHPFITVEHVLPQNPHSESKWVEWFPSEVDRQSWVHKLANLVLLSRWKNTQASNYDFERKKTMYFTRDGTTTFALTSRVLLESEWTPEILETRQSMLIRELAREWRLE